ncbi:ABC transporter substrate-binding protein [Oscillospiraceae bacterium OttesenSCG-928-F05]|nr:ABC transporter substrate-binding protein [Oscillospiraceae bacterium OttesenSCG-928-F05]
MRRKLVSLLLAALMLLALTACGTGGTDTPSDNPTNAPATSAPTAGDTPTQAPSDEVVTLRMVMMLLGSQPSDFEKVIGKINEIAIAETGTQIEVTGFNNSAYKEQMNLIFASQEKLDVFLTGTASMFDYANQVAKGMLTPLNDLLDTHGQDIKEVLGSYLDASLAGDGNYYGVTTRRDLSKAYGVQVVKEYMDKYDLDFEQYTAFEQTTPEWAKIKASGDDIIPVMGNRSGTLMYAMTALTSSDAASDNSYIRLMNPTESLELENIFATDIYQENARVAREWYNEGYTMLDAVTNTLTGFELMKSDRLVAYGSDLKAGEEGQTERSTGRETYVKWYTPYYANTMSTTSYMWGIPSHVEDAEAAMKFLNLMFASEDVVNLFCWGIEGEHYVITDTGNINYPDGVTSDNTGYQLNINWVWGDQFKSKVWGTDPVDLWEKMDYDNKNAVVSKALGFIFDTNPIKTQYAAVMNVLDEYRRSIEYGVVDPETAIPDFITKLESAGYNDIIAEKQAQLNAWAGV